jgi:hypothetical protein
MIYFYTAPKDNDFNEKTEIETTFLKRFRDLIHLTTFQFFLNLLNKRQITLEIPRQ